MDLFDVVFEAVKALDKPVSVNSVLQAGLAQISSPDKQQQWQMWLSSNGPKLVEMLNGMPN